MTVAGAQDCLAALSRIASRADLTLKVMRHTGRATPAEAYAAWRAEPEYVACQQTIADESEKLTPGWEDAVKASCANAAWDKLKAEAVSFVTAHIDWWREDHPGGDPLHDPKLMREIREVYQKSPASPATAQYLTDVAAALRLPLQQVQAMLGSADSDATAERGKPIMKRLGENQ